MVAYYQHDIAAWMDGTESLGDGEYRVYHVVCELMYLNGGPIVLHESGIAGRCNQHPLAFRRNLEKLVERGKIVRAGTKIMNPRVESELARIRSRRPKPPAHPGSTRGGSAGGPEGVGEGSDGGRGSKPLKNKEPTPGAGALDKRREEKIPEAKEASGAPPSAADLEKALFDRGKQILGKNAGGMITNLLKAKRYDYTAAMQAIEDASKKQDAREYVGAAIKAGSAQVKHGGAAAAMRALREARNEQEGFDNGSTGTDHPGGEIIPPGSTRGDHAHPVRARGR